jgi:hypothetical protein
MHKNQQAMSKSTKLSAFLSTFFLIRLLRRKKSAFAKQRRLLRGDYNLF